MNRKLRFKIHEISKLRPLDNRGKYVGRNPLNKMKDDLIVDSYHNYIIIKSDGFAGSWRDFQNKYKFDFYELKYKKNKNLTNNKKWPDLKLQKKLFVIDSKIEEISKEIKKQQKNFNTILDKSKTSKHYNDTGFDVKFQFYVSKKHTAFNPEDDNVVYEAEVSQGDKLDRREKDFVDFQFFLPRFQKKKWSAITYYLLGNCSEEDILCIDQIFVDIKPMVQLSTKIKSF